ncbi:M6 family metalloprotease domain-containing protein [Neobacillus sp.]|uniref:M6 family metalloprotease domain-containing protein n=1 Tax=Neobacillus sp. TaxID=2675273 RepID=UPI002899D742|nr:M6 family metalloprotease domain-containing protein [Neobacillus sp.]
MKKIFSLGLVLAMVFFSIVPAFAKSTPVTKKEFTPKLPDYQKVDPNLSKDVLKKGGTIKGKELHGYNGKSYSKPQETERLQPKRVEDLKTKGIAIVVDFPLAADGKSAVPGVKYDPIPINQFDDLINGDMFNPYRLDMFKHLATFNGKKASTNRTMKNFYKEVSYGKFSMDIDVAGWYTLPHSYDYYLGQNKGYHNQNGDAHIGELVKDAINLASKDVDFSQYAVPAQPGDFWLHGADATSFIKDGQTIDKIVPNLLIIHRGTGAEFSLDPSLIWSHKWDITSASYFGQYYQTGVEPDESTLEHTVVNGVAVDTYNIVPEVGQDITGYLKISNPDVVGPDYNGREPSPPSVGVFAHEFGHVLGLPDLYDYGYDSEGVGMYSLMAGGSYGRDMNNRYYSGNSPVHPDAWSKTYLGFAKAIEVNKNQQLTLRPVEQQPDIYKVNVPGSDGREYFLLENRQQTGFDAGLEYNLDGNKLHGLVVYHVVEDILSRNFWRPNEAQNWDLNHLGLAQLPVNPANGERHYAVSVVQADGSFDLEHYLNDGDSGDVFPGKYKVTSISPKGNVGPNTTSLYKWSKKGTETGIQITNIVEEANGTVKLNVIFNK